MAKDKVDGCRQRIKYCDAHLDNAAQACTTAPTPHGRRCAWRSVQWYLVQRNRLAQELKLLTTKNT